MVVQFLKNVVYYGSNVLMVVFTIPALPFLIIHDVTDKIWARGWARAFWRKD